MLAHVGFCASIDSRAARRASALIDVAWALTGKAPSFNWLIAGTAVARQSYRTLQEVGVHVSMSADVAESTHLSCLPGFDSS
jgi:hypothetical protein